MKKKLTHTVLQYTAVFEPDVEIGGFTVTIPALPGCISEADTFEEALANIQEAAELYLETLKQERKYIPAEPRGVVIAPVQVYL